MALISPVYCTEAEVVRFFSQVGVDDFGDNDADGTADTGVVDDCINQATEEIDLYATQRYSQAALGGSTLITRWAVVLATRFLCQRRGNPIPESVEAEFERIAGPGGKLEQISKGALQLPGVALRSDMRPTVSNLTVDRRHLRSTIRRTPTNSTDSPTELSRDDVIEFPGLFD